MRIRYVGQDAAAYGWCDHCDELTEFMVDGGIREVGTKRLCPSHAKELQEGLELAIQHKTVDAWRKGEAEATVGPKRSG
jgi:hypothetical protein